MRRVGLLFAIVVLLVQQAAFAADATIVIQNFAYSPSPKTITVSQTVAWNNQDQMIPHTATSRLSFNGTTLFDTGPLLGPQQSIDLGPEPAGKFVYFCTFHNFTGVLNVPVNVTSPQMRHNPFTVTWASTMPTNYVEDVQVKKPGATRFTSWVVGSTATSAQYTAGKHGTYRFRARLRSTDGKSSFSPPVAVHVA